MVNPDELTERPLCRYEGEGGTKMVLVSVSETGLYRALVIDFPIHVVHLPDEEAQACLKPVGNRAGNEEAVERFREYAGVNGINDNADKLLTGIESAVGRKPVQE